MLPVASSATGGDTGAHASDHTSPTDRGRQRRLFDGVGREGFNQQTDTSPSNLRPPDQRTALTNFKAADGEQQAAPTEKTTEDLMADLKRLQEHIDKKLIEEKEEEEKLHMIKAKTMRARRTRTAQLCPALSAELR
jgi:hypothetical protein